MDCQLNDEEPYKRIFFLILMLPLIKAKSYLRIKVNERDCQLNDNEYYKRIENDGWSGQNLNMYLLILDLKMTML